MTKTGFRIDSKRERKLVELVLGVSHGTDSDQDKKRYGAVPERAHDFNVLGCTNQTAPGKKYGKNILHRGTCA